MTGIFDNPGSRTSTRGKFAVLFCLGAFVGCCVSLLFIEGRGIRWGRFGSGPRMLIPIVDANEELWMFAGLALVVGCLVVRTGDDLWSTDAFKSSLSLSLEERYAAKRWTTFGMAIGAALVVIAIVRSH